MGQKVNPTLIRLKTVNTWSSRWFNERSYKETVLEDYTLRTMLMEKLKAAGIARVEIERSINSAKIIIYVSRPGMVIGRAGTGADELKKYISDFFIKHSGKHAPKLDLRIEPVKEPNLDAYLIGRSIADQLARRLPFKRVLNQTAEKVMGAGAKGVRIVMTGRINGAEIARREKIQQGTVPLSTIRANIEYASVPSLTKKGYIGVKVWVNKPEEKGQ